MPDHTQTVAVITGGGQGLGLAIASRLIAEGCSRILITGRDSSKGEKAAAGLRIVGADEGLALNRSYRQQDHATNVLTFDYEHTPVVVADLVLCAPVVQAEAAALGLSLQAHYAHLLVHGALHAQGHDHVDDDDAVVMEAFETRILHGLGFADPYRLPPLPPLPPLPSPPTPRGGRAA